MGDSVPKKVEKEAIRSKTKTVKSKEGVSIIVLSDDEVDVPASKKPRRLMKNGQFVREHEKEKKNESDDDQPIRFSRTKKKNSILKAKKPTNTVIDQSTDEDLDNFVDDEAIDDVVDAEEVLGESLSDLPHLDDFLDEYTDDYDYTDDFIDDGPLVDENEYSDGDSDN